MFLVAAVLVSAFTVPLFRGHLGVLLKLRLRHTWAIFAALFLEVLAMDLPGLPDRLRAGLLIAAYPVATVFLIANWRFPGIWLVALGAALNVLAMSVNGGVMPATPSALERAGLPVHASGFQNSVALANPRLAFLGDVFFLPASWPLSNVFSVGDVLIAFGVAWMLHRTCGSMLAGRRAHPG